MSNMSKPKEILINITNHPSNQFTKEMKTYVEEKYAKVIDIPYPHISKKMGDNDLHNLVNQLVYEVEHWVASLIKTRKVLHLDVSTCGEFGLTWLLVNKLKELAEWYSKVNDKFIDMAVVYPTNEREVVDRGEGKQTHLFKFYGFRRYL